MIRKKKKNKHHDLTCALLQKPLVQVTQYASPLLYLPEAHTITA